METSIQGQVSLQEVKPPIQIIEAPKIPIVHEMINERVDIFNLPKMDTLHQVNAGIQITLGDLHGNAMKLMFMLVKHGIAKNINHSDYQKLVAIYQTPTKDLTKNDIKRFNQILSKIEFSNVSLVRLIGDELADRGNNDYFTLKIIEQLTNHKVPLEIIVSNHSIEFIEAYEKQKKFKRSMLRYDLAQSLDKLQQLVEKGIVTRQEVLAIAKRSYKPTLRAISYSLSEDKKEITIYSHAGIGLNTIHNLAQKLRVDYKDATAIELAQTIDSINLSFQQDVQRNTVNTLYTPENLNEGYNGRDLSHAPFEFILWNRGDKNIDRPPNYYGYKVNFVHGHDCKDKTKDNIYNLDGDNELGKPDKNRGNYVVLYSRQGEVAPLKQAVSDATVINLPEVHKKFLSQLAELDAKELELRGKGHIAAANQASHLYNSLKNNHNELIAKSLSIDTFKMRCATAITIARPELEKHRGWKQVLGNLALAVVSLGVPYLIAGFFKLGKTGNFFFFKTDSANKVNQLEQSMQSLKGPVESR